MYLLGRTRWWMCLLAGGSVGEKEEEEEGSKRTLNSQHAARTFEVGRRWRSQADARQYGETVQVIKM